MISDIRISVDFPTHRKTMKLIRRLGPTAPWDLVRLWMYTARHQPDGRLTGMDIEDIEAAAGWVGEAGLFVETLQAVGFLDLVDGVYCCHDWLVHNPWVAESVTRSDLARFSRLLQQFPGLHAELRALGIRAINKHDYELLKNAASLGLPLANVQHSLTIASGLVANAGDNLANAGERQRSAGSSSLSTSDTVPDQKPKGGAAAGRRHQQQDNEQRIREVFVERAAFLTKQFPNLNLAVEVEQMVAKYRDRAIGPDAAVVVIEWLKRSNLPKGQQQVGKPDKQGRVDAGLAAIRSVTDKIREAAGEG